MRRWTILTPHPIQAAYWNSRHRFNTVPAGRRSGKTELAKRKLVRKALEGTKFPDPRFFAAAPTRDQAKRIYWQDLKALVPAELLDGKPSETDLIIRLVNQSELHIVGLDKPERIEGSPWDGGVLDEYANIRPEAWSAHIRPALADRNGWCDMIGVPEGRNHFYETDRAARALYNELGDASEWASFHWVSADILPASEIEAARRDLDELTFAQEFEASFVNFEGRAYYPFDERIHCARLAYDPYQPLAFCFDFNISPGVAVIVQEQALPCGQLGTGVIGEVHIPRNSNTPAVCRKLAAEWGGHAGPVSCYGDATGGAGGSAKIAGSDWDLIRAELKSVFRDRLSFKVPPANPAERARVNAVNTRLKAGDGVIRLQVDGAKAPNLVKDLEGVRLLMGGAGEIDKRADETLSHLSDALGYYVEREFPIGGHQRARATTVPFLQR
ncbi:MAG TPA: terminase family protein [Aliidongia sp.]|nr:terminase family protein [Aliidongia sp.]